MFCVCGLVVCKMTVYGKQTLTMNCGPVVTNIKTGVRALASIHAML